MSLQLRVLALMTLVAVAATAATAWLTLEQASRQITESAEAQRGDIDAVAEALTTYGQAHGTWEGVATLVDDLRHRTGHRIRLVTEYGQVLADTDTMDGRTARPTDGPPVPVNPRAQLALPEDVADPYVLRGITVDEIANYRSGVLLAACLTRRGVGVDVVAGRYGIPRFLPAPATTATGQPLAGPDECRDRAETDPGQQRHDAARAQQCTDALPAPPEIIGEERPAAEPRRRPDIPLAAGPDLATVRGCLSQVFAHRTAEVAPVAIRAHLGAVEEAGPPLSPWPVLAAATLVAAFAVAGSVLVSRRVLHPIRGLTGAARRLGEGDLSRRVPVAGRDELAELASSFNRMADSLQRGEDRQRRLIADAAHELRTPLANVRGYLEALRDGVLAPDPELFSSLYEEAVLQQRVVDDLQELALAEAGALVYHRARVDLGELLEASRAAHQAVADIAGVHVSASAVERIHVLADQDRLRQVLGNLVGNAVRATAPGGAVTLAASRTGGTALVTVADTGSGIPAEHLPYVFDRFWRADPARQRSTGGGGLGLAIAWQLVADHGGTIDVASELGVGTTFTVRLPVDGAGGEVRGQAPTQPE